MAPGRKSGTSKPTQSEAPLCAYENARNQNILRNSLFLQRLGVSAAASLLNSSIARTTKRKASAREDSAGSLYEPDDNEDSDQEVMQNSSVSKERTMNCSTPSGGMRLSKRVMAPHGQEPPIRHTRQRTRELLAEDGTSSDPLVAATCSAEPEINIQNCNEDGPDSRTARPSRGRNMGKGLDRMTRGLNTKIPVHIVEGKRRPEAPMQAAKLASEGGIILRQHIPVLPHWKHYKKDKAHVENYIGKVAGYFVINTSNKAVKDACTDLLKCGQRQMRYNLKKKHFDGLPANQVPTTSPVACMTDEQWLALVAMWSDPKHKKQDKYKDVVPTEIDLFKECHCSTKTGFTEPVKKAIAAMEALVGESAEEGQAQKTPAQIVSEVLPKTTFLQNAGLETTAPKRSKAAAAAVAARVEELEGELDAERQVAEDLRGKVEQLIKRTEDSEAARMQQSEEVQNLKSSLEETQALLRGLLKLNKF